MTDHRPTNTILVDDLDVGDFVQKLPSAMLGVVVGTNVQSQLSENLTGIIIAWGSGVEEFFYYGDSINFAWVVGELASPLDSQAVTIDV